MADIKQIAQAALSSIDNVLNHWCAGGKRQGHEYVTLNPTRSDNKAGSFSVNLNTGVWGDFATGDKGGDLVALVAYIDNVKMGEAAKRLAQFLGLKTDKEDAHKRATSLQNNEGNTSISATQNKTPAALTADDGYVCVMPIPSDAPAPPNSHMRHGKPSKRYEYLALDGLVNFYHDRYEAKNDGEKKQFAPLTFWRNENTAKGEWRYKAPPANRPLYGLPKLAALPDAHVWIVEGEKAADALAALMPNNPVVCWQGGAQAVAKADFSVLAGRYCIVWPDNDQPGINAAFDVAHKLKTADAKTVKTINLNALAIAVNGLGYQLKSGDDAHDLTHAGIDNDKLLSALNSSEILVEPERKDQAPAGDINEGSKSHIFKRHFIVNDDGVYVVDVTRERDAYQAPKWICAKLEVLALSRSPHNGEWGSLVRFKDRDFVEHRFIIPARSFNGEGLDATGLLYENGLTIAHKARPLVLEYLQQQQPEKRARVTNRLGWHGEGDSAVFVMPNGAVGDADEEWIFDNASPNTSTFKKRGTVEAWRDNVANLCVGNSRLVFAVSIAFAAPLRHLLDIKDLGGFHYRGSSSDGKSTALRMAGSVCGGHDYMQRWRASDNGLESLAMQHCDAPLLLDELKQLDPKVAGEAAYMLANGSGKARANEKGGARKTAQWRLIFLSAGEVGLSQHMLEAGKRVHAGQEIRMADIPADAGAGLGCFEELHGYENGNEFAKAISSATSKYYGAAFGAFIGWVIKHKSDVIHKLLKAQNGFDKGLLSDSASGQARRVASLFSLVGAAGELATEAGLTGWTKGESFKAAGTCFKAWLHGFGGEGNQEQRSMLSQVKMFIEQHGEGRMADLDRNAISDDHAARVMNKAGYRKHDKDAGTTEYYFYPEVFKTEVCKGFDPKAVIKMLIDKGYMHKGEDRHPGQPKRNLPEGAKRVYHIYSSIFGDENAA